jgi:hypothetical protein
MTTKTIDIYRGPATIEMDAGDAIEVDCRYSVQQEVTQVRAEEEPGVKSWAGSFTTHDPLIQAGEGVLRLDDGRSARILVTSVHLDVGGGIFTGTGHPPD